jgi:hypothetical protein
MSLWQQNSKISGRCSFSFGGGLSRITTFYPNKKAQKLGLAVCVSLFVKY